MTAETKPLSDEYWREFIRALEVFARHHETQASFGGSIREFHERACSNLHIAGEHLIRLRAENARQAETIAKLREELATQRKLFTERRQEGTDAADDLIVKLMHLNSGMHNIIVHCALTGTVDAAWEYLKREESLKAKLDAERKKDPTDAEEE